MMITEFGKSNKVIAERSEAHLKKVAEILSEQAKSKSTFWVYLGKWKDNPELSKDPVDILEAIYYLAALHCKSRVQIDSSSLKLEAARPGLSRVLHNCPINSSGIATLLDEANMLKEVRKSIHGGTEDTEDKKADWDNEAEILSSNDECTIANFFCELPLLKLTNELYDATSGGRRIHPQILVELLEIGGYQVTANKIILPSPANYLMMLLVYWAQYKFRYYDDSIYNSPDGKSVDDIIGDSFHSFLESKCPNAQTLKVAEDYFEYALKDSEWMPGCEDISDNFLDDYGNVSLGIGWFESAYYKFLFKLIDAYKSISGNLGKYGMEGFKSFMNLWFYEETWMDEVESLLEGTEYTDAMAAYICSSSYVNGLGIVGTEYSGLLYLLKLCLTGKVNLATEKIGKADFMKCDQLLLDYEHVMYFLNNFQYELLSTDLGRENGETEGAEGQKED